MTLEEARAYEATAALRRDINSLKNQINQKIEERRSDPDKDNFAVNNFYISEYKKLLATLDTPIDKATYDDIYWLYNYGDLRTDSECYVHSGEFQSDCNKRSYGLPYGLFFGGYLIVLIPFMAKLYDGSSPSVICGFIGGSVLGCLLGGILGLIGCAVGESINKSESERMLNQGIDEATPMAKRARTNLNVTAASTALVSAHLVHHAHKNVKDITNVDGWKEMK